MSKLGGGDGMNWRAALVDLNWVGLVIGGGVKWQDGIACFE